MKICMIGSVYEPIPRTNYGGIEEYIFKISTELGLLGHEVHILTVKSLINNINPHTKGVHFHQLMYQCSSHQPLMKRILNHITFYRKVWKYLDSHKDFDIIHFNTNLVGNRLLLKRPVTPTVYTAHTGFPWIVPWRSIAGSNGIEKFLLDVDDYLKILFAKRVDMNVAVGSEVAMMMAKKGVAKERITVIINSVDVERFHITVSESQKETFLKKYKFPPNCTLFLFLAALRPDKCADLLLVAFKRMLEIHPKLKEKVFLFIAGGGIELNKLTLLSKKLGLSANIRFLGRMVEPDELPEMYSYCDVYVLPSIAEAMPLTALEALAAGKVVIMTDIFGRDIITDGKEGYLVPRYGVKELSVALSKSVDPKIRQEFTAAASKKSADFLWRKNATKLLKVYESLCN